MYKLTKNFRFEAAHRLSKGYVGKCANIHGHSWNGVLELVSPEKLDQFGMGVDYYNMGAFTKVIEELLDHKILLCVTDVEIITLCERNDWKLILFTENPTCEVLSKFIYEKACDHFGLLNIQVKSVTIKETCTTSCTYGN